MQVLTISMYDYKRNTCLHYIDELELLCIALGCDCYMMNRIRHNSPSPVQCLWAFHILFFAYSLFRGYCYNHYKTQKYYFFYRYRYFHTTLLQILSYPGVVELTTQLLILENILWLPLCRINKFGWIPYPQKLLRSPILVGYQDYFLALLPGNIALFFESLGIYICWSLWGTWKTKD